MYCARSKALGSGQLLAPVCSLEYSLKALFSTLVGQERNHSVSDPQLEPICGELPVAGEERGDELHVIEGGHGAHFRHHVREHLKAFFENYFGQVD